jgi:pyruvate dehydrogenase (quinone)/pyruvate oxidase
MLGNPEYACDLQPIDFAKFASACGGDGFRVEHKEDCGKAAEAFLTSPGPALLEAVIDPNEPPMPPQATAKQALNFARSLAQGTPDGAKLMKQVLADVVREMV